uniref:NADH-quinone oxidoreductase subunit D domain-containing protein n=1 Tax=Solanum lycopersicum TaxID=4081 RepID=A0A3Q7GA30_SOLLC
MDFGKIDDLIEKEDELTLNMQDGNLIIDDIFFGCLLFLNWALSTEKKNVFFFMGLSGPMLRASGIEWDLRKVDHYESYDEFDWQVQWIRS